MFALFALAACTEHRSVTGTVKDVWEKPVADATVVVEGVMERFKTDDKGRFAIELEADQFNVHDLQAQVVEEDGAGSGLGRRGVRVMVGKDGYVKDVGEALEGDPEADFDPLSFSLYPEPAEPGFYAVGSTAYVALGHQRIQMVGTDLAHYAGVQDIPEEAVPAGEVEFVFTTRLRPSEIAQMNLHLSKMEFINKGRIKGVFGPQDATVNLWVAKDDVAFDVEALDSRDDYLIKSRGKLEPGVYAFHAHDVLHEEDERVLYSLPKEQQIAFPFEVK